MTTINSVGATYLQFVNEHNQDEICNKSVLRSLLQAISTLILIWQVRILKTDSHMVIGCVNKLVHKSNLQTIAAHYVIRSLW